MVQSPVDERPELELVDLARAGDREAFATLYDRHFARIYDFAGRLMRDRDETADVVQDTFLKAMNSIEGLKSGASFKSWLFTIARNTALGRLERSQRTRPLSIASDEDEEDVPLDVVDPDRLADPAQAAEANAMAALVWEAAAGLDPRQLSLLDLVVRQGLESAEIADVMGVSKNNAYVMVNRLKSAVEEAISAFVMLKTGRNDCAQLDAIVTTAESDAMSPALRRQVSRHIGGCAECDERRKKRLSPLAVLGGFAPLVAPPDARGLILEQITNSGSSAGAGAGGGGATTPGSGFFLSGGWLGRKLLLAAGATLAGIVALFVVLPASPLTGDDSTAPPAEDGGLVGGAVPSETPTVAASAPAESPTVEGAGVSGATPSPSPTGVTVPSSAAGGSPSRTPTRTRTAISTATPTGTPATATSTPRPASTATNTPTPTATIPPRTATPSPTATACPTTLTVQPANLVLSRTRTAKIQVDNDGCETVELAASSSAPWVVVMVVTPKLAAGDFGIIDVRIDAQLLPEGLSEAEVQIAGGGISLTVPVSYTLSGSAPTILGAAMTCVRQVEAELVVSASDDYEIAAVVAVVKGSPPVTLAQTPGTPAKGTWEAVLFGVLTSTRVEVSVFDRAGQETTAVVSCAGLQ